MVDISAGVWYSLIIQPLVQSRNSGGTMIALFDFAPKFCPNCGQDLNQYAAEYDAGVSYGCPCAPKVFMYQKASTADLVEAADKFGGDLSTYAKRYGLIEDEPAQPPCCDCAAGTWCECPCHQQ
jgi:hypothetical protein